MRFPVGRAGNTLDPLWYDAQGFGVQTSYGYHEGMDLNLRTGGNTDLGEPLYAVADGKIVYYHNASHPTSGFGRHMVLECETSRGKRWYHYCHCQEITAQVKEVKEGEVIGKLGNSGTTLAHLHFAVFKVDPSSLYKGIDSIAKTKTELNASWEKFELLSMPENTYTEEQMTAMRLERDANWQKYQDEKADHDATKAQLDEEKQSNAQFIQTLASKLTTIADEGAIVGAVERLLAVEDQLLKCRKDYTQLEKEKFMLEADKNREIAKLKAEVDAVGEQLEQQQEENTRLATQVKQLSERIDDLLDQPKPQKPISGNPTGLQKLLNSIKSVVRRLLWLEK